MKNKDNEEFNLIEKALKGNQKALWQLLQSKHNRLYAFIFKLTNNHYLAEDILHDSYIKIMSKIKQFKKGTNFNAWVYALVRNLTIDKLRRNKRGNEIIKQQFKQADSFNPPEIEAEQNELAEILNKAIDKLSPEQKEVVSLRIYSGLTFNEISSILGVSINTTLARMRYAINNLRKSLNNIDMGF